MKMPKFVMYGAIGVAVLLSALFAGGLVALLVFTAILAGRVVFGS